MFRLCQVFFVYSKEMLKQIGLGVLLVTFICSISWGDEQTLYVRMSQIQREVDTTEALLEKLKGEFKALQVKKREVDSRIGELAREIESLNQRIQVLGQERDNLTARVLDAEHNVARTRDNMRSRIRTLYQRSVVGAPPLLVRVIGDRNRYELSFYARKIRAHDSGRFAELSAALIELQNAQRALEQSYAVEREAQSLLLQTQQGVQSERTSLAALLSEMKKKQAAAKQSLVRLQGKARVLEQLLENLLRREERPPENLTPTSEVSSPPPKKSSGRHTNHPQDVDLRLAKGLFTKGLKVQRPVGGHVVRGFGKTRVRSFSDIVFSKGVELHVEGTDIVHSIAPGRVAFAGAMPGYDKVVIIDHGARSYSLYGRLGSYSVSVGEMISGGGDIGMVARQEPPGNRPFYFEIRKNGKPVDPTSLVVF